MMRRLRFCCEGVDIISLTAEPKEKITSIEDKKTEQWRKASDASVIPPKRKCVKNMVCNCFVNCICAKCLKINTDTVSPPSNFNTRISVCPPSHPIHAPANYINKTKPTLRSRLP